MPQLLAIQIPWRGQVDLVPALAALVGLNRVFIPMYGVPPLYSTHVRYQREGKKKSGAYYERWLVAPEVLRHGHGDCEDLASWLAAEYQLKGDRGAMAIPIPSGIGWHIVCKRGDGTIEDPSRKLGM